MFRALTLTAACLAVCAPGAAQRDTIPVRRDTVNERAIRLEALLISSTRSGRRIEDEPLRVEIVGREEIEEKLRMTPGDIAMLLNETGGVRVQATAPALGGAAVRIQGLRGRYSQILSDGLPLFGEATGLGALQIPPMDLGRVEVIEGAASALYGASALGGVINLISRRPDGVVELLANRTTRAGTDGILWAASDEDAAVRWTLMSGVHDQRRVEVDGDGWADIAGYTRLVARPRLFLASGTATLMLTAGAMREDRIGGGVGGAVRGIRQEVDTRRIDGGLAGAAWLGSMRATMRASAAEQRHTRRYSGFQEGDQHRAYFAEAALGTDRGGHTLVAGAALQHDERRAAGRPDLDAVSTTPGIFVQDEWRPQDWFAIVLSARIDVPSGREALVSPRLSALLRPGEWSVRASAGLGHHVPTVWIEEVEAIGVSALTRAATLDVERARSGSVDVSRTFGALEMNGTVFGSVVEDAVALRRTDDGVVVGNVPGDTRTWGAELLARLGVEPVHATLSYAWTRAREPDPDGGGTRREVALTPRHTAGLVVAVEDEERGRIGAELYYTGTQALHEDPYRARSRPYVVFGVLAERRLGSASIFINLENIGNVRQTRYTPFLLPGARVSEPFTTEAWAPLDGRVINAGIRYRLRGRHEH